MKLATVTVSDLLEGAAEELEAVGVESPRLDVEILLAEAMGVGREDIYADPDREASPAALKVFRAQVRRRSKREPVAYILGRAHFRNLELAVNRNVLIPRPETELLVEMAQDGERVLDVGTGSGAIALAIADEREGVQVTATDISSTALTVARQNAVRLSLQVKLIQVDLVAGGPYDLIVSNPPYVREEDWPDLQPEITEYEPEEALLAGSDGLDVVRRLVEVAPDALATGGRLALEVGVGQSGDAIQMMRDRGFKEPEVLRDLSEMKRVVWAEWPCETVLRHCPV